MDDEREEMIMFAAVLEELQRIHATLATIAAGLLGKTTPHPPEPSPVLEPESHGPGACARSESNSKIKNFFQNQAASSSVTENPDGSFSIDASLIGKPYRPSEPNIPEPQVKTHAPSFYPGSRAQQLSGIDAETPKAKMPKGWTYGGNVPFQTWKPDETPYYFPGLKLDLE